MSDFINNLVSILEPTILDLDDKIKELSVKQETLNEVSRTLEFVGDDVGRIVIPVVSIECARQYSLKVCFMLPFVFAVSRISAISE